MVEQLQPEQAAPESGQALVLMQRVESVEQYWKELAEQYWKGAAEQYRNLMNSEEALAPKPIGAQLELNRAGPLTQPQEWAATLREPGQLRQSASEAGDPTSVGEPVQTSGSPFHLAPIQSCASSRYKDPAVFCRSTERSPLQPGNTDRYWDRS